MTESAILRFSAKSAHMDPNTQYASIGEMVRIFRYFDCKSAFLQIFREGFQDARLSREILYR